MKKLFDSFKQEIQDDNLYVINQGKLRMVPEGTGEGNKTIKFDSPVEGQNYNMGCRKGVEGKLSYTILDGKQIKNLLDKGHICDETPSNQGNNSGFVDAFRNERNNNSNNKTITPDNIKIKFSDNETKTLAELLGDENETTLKRSALVDILKNKINYTQSFADGLNELISSPDRTSVSGDNKLDIETLSNNAQKILKRLNFVLAKPKNFDQMTFGDLKKELEVYGVDVNNGQKLLFFFKKFIDEEETRNKITFTDAQKIVNEMKKVDGENLGGILSSLKRNDNTEIPLKTALETIRKSPERFLNLSVGGGKKTRKQNRQRTRQQNRQQNRQRTRQQNRQRTRQQNRQRTRQQRRQQNRQQRRQQRRTRRN